MKTKGIFAAILAAVMVACLLPTAAFATGESGIQLGTSGLKKDDEVYFGDYTESGKTYDVPWVVLSKGTNEAFLLSKSLLGDSQFQSVGIRYYSGSTLNTRMDELYSGTATLFTSQERGAIATRTNLSCVDGQYDDTNSPAVPTAHLYPLSYNEAAALTWGSDTLKAPYITNQSGNTGWWWLRSSNTADDAFCVFDDGNFNFRLADSLGGVRPALNLDLSSVLFTSAAVGGKSSGAEGAGALNSNLTPFGATTWKLTLRDNAMGSGRENFNVTTTTVSVTTAGGDVSIEYSGAKVGNSAAPEYLSAMLVDVNGKVLYYGRLKSIATSADAAGTQQITIPALAPGTYTLKIFNEQYNGDYNTDYASAIKDVTLTVAPLYAYNTPTVITANGVTATVIFDKPSPQTANTSVTAAVTLSGTAAAAGTHTINLSSNKTNLAGTAQNITVMTGQSAFSQPNAYTFTIPAQDVDDLILTHSFTTATYAYNTPTAIAANGVTATVTFDKPSPQTANTPITATVTLSGAAAATGTHSINLSSAKAGLAGTAQNITVTAGQNLTTAPVAKNFTFTVPAQDVDDLTLTHTFTATPIISFTAQPVASTAVMEGSITARLTAAAAVSPSGTATLNWYACDTSGTPSGISLGTGGTFAIPIALTAGTYHYRCQATAQGATAVNSDVAVVTVSAATDPAVGVSPSATFRQGNAPITTLTIGEGIPGFNAANNFDSVGMDGNRLALGVNTVQVMDGSIILQFNPLYLNTLSVGTHTVTIALKGGVYAGRTVSTTLTVTQGAPVVAPPKTGDSANPMLWLGLMLLGGAGLAGLWLRRKRRA